MTARKAECISCGRMRDVEDIALPTRYGEHGRVVEGFCEECMRDDTQTYCSYCYASMDGVAVERAVGFCPDCSQEVWVRVNEHYEAPSIPTL